MSPAQRALRDEIEHDLALTLTRKGPADVRAGDEWKLEASIVNRSSTRSHWIVKVNDGSEAGWREPTFGLTAEMQDAFGAFHELPERRGARCGNYASAWDRDGVLLLPGASVAVDWIESPDIHYELTRTGRVRLVARYAYEGGTKRSFDWNDGAERPIPPELAALPPFELVSPPLELAYRTEELFELRIATKAPLAVGVKTPLAAVLDVSITNRSGATVPVNREVELEVEPYDDDWKAFTPELVASPELGPGASSPLRPKVGYYGDALLRTTPGKVRVRLVYAFVRTRGDGSETYPVVYSDWVELDVR